MHPQSARRFRQTRQLERSLNSMKAPALKAASRKTGTIWTLKLFQRTSKPSTENAAANIKSFGLPACGRKMHGHGVAGIVIPVLRQAQESDLDTA